MADIDWKNFFTSQAFWSSVIGIIFIVAAVTWPEQKPIFEQLQPLVITLILSLVGKATVDQYVATRNGLKRENGKWVKIT